MPAVRDLIGSPDLPRLDLHTMKLVLDTQRREYEQWGEWPTAKTVATLIGLLERPGGQES